jgi:hypothetical protein
MVVGAFAIKEDGFSTASEIRWATIPQLHGLFDDSCGWVNHLHGVEQCIGYQNFTMGKGYPLRAATNIQTAELPDWKFESAVYKIARITIRPRDLVRGNQK